MVMIFLENSNIEKVQEKLSQCFFTNLEWIFGTWRITRTEGMAQWEVFGALN